jgi:hypothetical protein
MIFLPPTVQAHHVPLFHFMLQSTTMRSKTAGPKRQAFKEAIIILVIRLSHYYYGRWFTAQDMPALLVDGGIEDDELTDKHVTFQHNSLHKIGG